MGKLGEEEGGDGGRRSASQLTNLKCFHLGTGTVDTVMSGREGEEREMVPGEKGEGRRVVAVGKKWKVRRDNG